MRKQATNNLRAFLPDLYATTREKRAYALLDAAQKPLGYWTYVELQELRRLAAKHIDRFKGSQHTPIGDLLRRLEEVLGAPNS